MKKRPDGRYRKSVTINGKRVYFYSNAATERAAEKDIARQLIEYEERETRGKTFREVADEWEELHFQTIAYQTAVRYKSLKNHAVEWFNKQRIKEITAEHITAFLAWFSSAGYSKKSIKDQFSVMRLIFRYAMLHRYVETDATAYVHVPKGKPKTERRPLTDDEIAAVEQHADTPMGLFAYMLLYTGMRKGEALALQWQDIDLKNRKISVTKSVYFDGNNPRIKTPKTAAGTRQVIIPECLLTKLKKGFPTVYLFGANGSPMTRAIYKAAWRNYQKDIGCTFTAHQLRHTYATLLFEANITAKDAQRLLGHADIATTQNIYTHIRESRTAEIEKTLNNFFKAKEK